MGKSKHLVIAPVYSENSDIRLVKMFKENRAGICSDLSPGLRARLGAMGLSVKGQLWHWTEAAV